MKYIYWIVGLFAIAVTALSLALSFVDWNQYRGTLADLASEQTGMKVELAGNVSATLFPRPAVSIESVRLSPLASDFTDTIATAERIDVRLGMANILKGAFSIQSLVLDGVDITLEETEAGEWRVKGWPQADGSSSEATPIDLERFELQGSKITVAPYRQQAMIAEGLSMELDGQLPTGPVSWQGAFFLNGQEITSTGEFKPVAIRNETAIKLDFYGAEANLSLKGRLAEEGNLTGRLQLEGDDLQKTVYLAAQILGDDVASVPALPFSIDMQVDKEGGISRAVSRAFSLGDTNGRVDLTIAHKEQKNHITGSVSLGVINLNDWDLGSSDISGTSETKQVIEPDSGTQQKTLPIAGSIDLMIEGIQLRGGLGQRVDAVLAFDETGPNLTRLQALLPGATTFAFSGKLGTDGGTGKLQLNVGNIAGLSRWLQVDMVEDVPAGRLTTASLKSDVELSENTWALRRIRGLFDTTVVMGEVLGDTDTAVPQHITLEADTVNLDAYLPNKTKQLEQKNNAVAFSVPDTLKIGFDFQVSRLQWLGASFEDVAINGAVSDGKLTIAGGDIHQGQGVLTLLDTSLGFKQNSSLALNARMKNWPLPVTRRYLPDLKEQLRAAGFEKVNGTLSLAGPLNALRTGLDIRNNQNSLTASGTVGVEDEQVVSMDVQGSLAHDNLAPLLRSFDAADLKKLPVTITARVSKASSTTPYVLKAGGDVAGAKVQLDASFKEKPLLVSLLFDHSVAGDFLNLLGLSNPGLDPTQAMRGEIKYDVKTEGGRKSLIVKDFSNGGVSLNGIVFVDDKDTIGGSLSLVGFDVDKAMINSSTDTPNDTSSLNKLSVMEKYAGTIDLSLERVRVRGQELNIPKASILVGDGIMRLSTPESARMNGAALIIKADLDVSGDMPISGTIQADNVDLTAAFVSSGASNIISAASSFTMDVSGDLSKGIAGLKGNGKLIGKSGKLNFLSVPTLVTQMTSAKTGRGFLGNIGTLLRQGSTPMNTLETSFTLDGGVMLIETATATGSWGDLSLDGQVNLVDRFLSLKGALSLLNPAGTPAIPVTYEGGFDGPTAQWSSRLFERYVLAGIEQRIRGALFKDMEDKKAGEGADNNPGLAVFNSAFSFLGQLRQKQKEEQAQRLKAEQAAKAAVQAAAEQKP